MKIKEYADSDMMMMALANILAGEMMNILLTQERVSLAVPGGTTPGPVFDTLAAVRLPWDRVDIVLTDERWVPEDSPRSNTRLIREHLLKDLAAAANYIPLYSGDPDPAQGVAAVIERVERLSPISVALLGMGEDMQVAGLVPGAENLALMLNEDAPAVMAVEGGDLPEPRITLTAPMLSGALSRHMVITGAAKRAALEQAERIGDPMKAPAAAVLSGLTVHWAE